MANTKRLDILLALQTLVATITIEGGFQTDAGATVFLGEVPELGEDDANQAIALLVGDDEPGADRMVVLPVTVVALVDVEQLDAPWLALEAVLGDIKKAIETEDRTLGGLLKGQLTRGQTQTFPREAGSRTLGVGVTYRAPYLEVWGQP